MTESRVTVNPQLYEKLLQDIIWLEKCLQFNWPLALWLHESSGITSRSGLRYLLRLKKELDLSTNTATPCGG